MKKIIPLLILFMTCTLFTACKTSQTSRTYSNPFTELCSYCSSIDGAEKVKLSKGLLSLVAPGTGFKKMDIIECDNLSKKQKKYINGLMTEIDANENNLLTIRNTTNNNYDFICAVKENNDVSIGIVCLDNSSIDLVVVKVSKELYDKIIEENNGDLDTDIIKDLLQFSASGTILN